MNIGDMVKYLYDKANKPLNLKTYPVVGLPLTSTSDLTFILYDFTGGYGNYGSQCDRDIMVDGISTIQIRASNQKGGYVITGKGKSIYFNNASVKAYCNCYVTQMEIDDTNA